LVPLEEIKSEDVLKWLNNFSTDKKPKTVDLFLSCLSSFFNFCLAEDYMDTVVIKKRWRPKIPQALPKFLNDQEYARVKLVAETLSLRIVHLFYSCFLQVAEGQKCLNYQFKK
jgi:integrase/recombinase XerD